jgi:endoglucanase
LAPYNPDFQTGTWQTLSTTAIGDWLRSLGASGFESLLTPVTQSGALDTFNQVSLNQAIAAIAFNRISGTASGDFLPGTIGNDYIFGDASGDLIRGNGGNDLINGGTGGDLIVSNAGNDYLVGDAGNDNLEAGAGNDLLFGGVGTDTLKGGEGQDLLSGGAENDVLECSAGNDLAIGGLGDDRLYGQAGNDGLWGNEGNDLIWGDDGDDRIFGGLGNDILEGGAGADTFVFTIGEGSDTIKDFTNGVDRIQLTGGLTFDQVEVIAQGADTQLRFKATGQNFAFLQKVQAGLIDRSDFIVDVVPTPTPTPPPTPVPIPPPPPVVNNGQERVTNVYLVRPDLLAVEIEVGKVEYGKQIAYVAQAGDVIYPNANPLDSPWLERGGKVIGALVGPQQKLLYTFDKYVGDDSAIPGLDVRSNYQLTSTGDSDYQIARSPDLIYQKNKPTDMARVGQWDFKWAQSYTVYLDLPQNLDLGANYALKLPDTKLGTVNFTYSPEVMRSEAVHVSQLGFRPDDPAKVGFLSTWLGTGGGLTYGAGLNFWLINEKTGQKVFNGKVTLSKDAVSPEDPYGINYNKTDVYQMDFSSFNTAGNYRLCVEGIGSSFGFTIGNQTWQNAFEVSIEGFYNQRSGIALDSAYSAYQKPRGFNGLDGVKVYQSNARLVDTDMGLGTKNAFQEIVANRTTTVLPTSSTWGGYFDAGDWDRRIQHLEATRSFLELEELFPQYFATLNLNLPESNNALPDIVDEALWNLDFFRRMQASNGGISGGIEMSEHPKFGETSWTNSLEVFAYAPDAWSSYIYAGVAAKAANILQNFNPTLAATYRDSALRAMAFAEAEFATTATPLIQVKDERNLAALELYRLTKDNKWHQLFLSTTAFTTAADSYVWQNHQQRNAAFAYARMADADVNVTIKQNARNAVLREADGQKDFGSKTGFKWTKMNAYEPVGWGTSFGAPRATTLLQAHALTGNDSYLQAGILASQFSAGANPDNLVYTTGLGQRSPLHPLVLDQRITGQAAPRGITIYGPNNSGDWVKNLMYNQVNPNPYAVPTTEGFYDVYLYPQVTEFTIMETMAPTAYTWGYLAARGR